MMKEYERKTIKMVISCYGYTLLYMWMYYKDTTSPMQTVPFLIADHVWMQICFCTISYIQHHNLQQHKKMIIIMLQVENNI